MRHFLTHLLLFAVLLAAPLTARAAAPDYVWLEGEAAQTNTPVNLSGWGHKEFLSGEKWLHLSVDADKVESAVPADGALLKYPFTVKGAAHYQIWNRIGFEFVRSPFEWRIDSGAWATVTPDQLTTDLMEMDTWCEVAWIQMGAQDLTAGDHTLEIRLPRTKDAQGKTQRILYASDALCLTAGPFAPNSHFKPDESGRTAADEAAAKNIFALPDATDAGHRVSVELKGQWEICRNDEQTPGEVATPIKDFPQDPHWTAIAVPGDKNELRPDLLFAHRVWYRTKVEVPKSLAGQSFELTFPQNNLNTTVYVNGVYCGFNKNPYARVTFDLTPGMKIGANEVWVGIRDAWYGYSANPKNPMKLRRQFNLPLSVTGNGFQDLAYPIWNAFHSGILNTPRLIASGSTYAADVFCKPSVARKEMSVDVRLASHLPAGAKGEVVCEAVDPKTGRAEKAIGSAPFTSSTEQTVTVRGAWADPKLWWPDDPQMYWLRTTVKIDGKTVDVSDTPFGFREWGAQGKDFTLNGVPWHGWADLQPGATPAEWLGNYQKTQQTMMRYMGASQGGTNWIGLPPQEALDFFDTHGVVVRRCGPLDGEAIGYNAIENDPDLQALNKSTIKMDLMRNWRDQMAAQVEGERNHPSIMLWSIENEWLYINCINLYGDKMPLFEAETAATSDAVRATDPTRLTMTDGGGANADQSMPVHGNHYVFDSGENVSKYPALAYEANPNGGGRGRWTWDEKRPRFLGEDFYATGINPFDYGYFGGEDAFQGKAQARPAVGLVYQILTEGYRWAGYGAWHLWSGPSDGDQYAAQAPRAVFCRQWDWTFGAGQRVSRTLGIFNDTHSDKPIGFTWSLMMGGKQIATQTTTHHVAPGHSEKFEVALVMPAATVRQEGTWTLALSVDGHSVYKDSKAVSILPIGPAAARPIAAALAADDLAVYDPSGATIAFLKASRISFTPITSLTAIPAKAHVLIVGRNALTAAQSASSALAAFASAGRTVIVLEQTNPLKYQGVPAQIDTASNEGRTAFAEDLAHPALAGLRQKDFFTWGPNEVVYRNAYLKPASGGKSLIQCHNRLQNTALVEVPAGKGLMLLSQLTLEEKLATNAVAQRLLLNLIRYGRNYKQEFRPVTALLADAQPLGKALDAMGVEYAKAADPLAAISPPGEHIAVISATPANLKTLAGNLAKVKAFTAAGGWIVFNGLTPDGLADYNQIVGVDHMIRPFRRERVTFASPRNPLTAGLTTADIVMHSGERIFNWTSDEYVASDIFSYVLDYDDVAPFATFPNDFLANMVNGFVSADGWPYIVNVPTSPEKPFEFTFHLPKSQEITEFDWTGNTFYYPTTKVTLTFDGHMDKMLSFDTRPDNTPQVFPIAPPRAGQDITMRLAAWNAVNTAPNVGVDNVSLKAKRSPEFYQKVKPMLNVGAMLEYKIGAGGIVLCNVLFKDTETVAENAGKKRALLAAVLRNLSAPFGGAKNVIAGAGLHYTPVDISKQANQYRDERGWFGDKSTTFADLPTGKQTFAGVPFQIYAFPTSPVPTAIMLGGPSIPNNLPDAVHGIPVGRKADALFFLQAARIDQRRSNDEVKNGKQFEMARYVVHYTDGQTATIPVRSEIDVDDYKQKTPAALPGAQIAWTKPYAGTEYSAVAYLMTWNNPRPDAEIASVDLEYGAERRGVIALLAVTAGE